MRNILLLLLVEVSCGCSASVRSTDGFERLLAGRLERLPTVRLRPEEQSPVRAVVLKALDDIKFEHLATRRERLDRAEQTASRASRTLAKLRRAMDGSAARLLVGNIVAELARLSCVEEACRKEDFECGLEWDAAYFALSTKEPLIYLYLLALTEGEPSPALRSARLAIEVAAERTVTLYRGCYLPPQPSL